MNTKGFTLIEVMIATGLFVVLMIFGVGAIMNTNVVFKKNQTQRAILDNMAFIVEDMSRLMRTGYNFNCSPSILPTPPAAIEAPSSCAVGVMSNQIAFEGFGDDNNAGVPGDPTDQIVYAITSDGLYKSENGGASLAQNGQFRLTDSSVEFDTVKSGFWVYGAEIGDSLQPVIVVRLAGKIEDQQADFETGFSYQFTITQRRIDS